MEESENKKILNENEQTLDINGQKYLVHKGSFMAFNTAKSFCDDLGMQLPVPVDQAMNDALYDITGGNFYLGISDAAVEDDFRNVYTDTTITFSNWNRVS